MWCQYDLIISCGKRKEYTKIESLLFIEWYWRFIDRVVLIRWFNRFVVTWLQNLVLRYYHHYFWCWMNWGVNSILEIWSSVNALVGDVRLVWEKVLNETEILINLCHRQTLNLWNKSLVPQSRVATPCVKDRNYDDISSDHL